MKREKVTKYISHLFMVLTVILLLGVVSTAADAVAEADKVKLPVNVLSLYVGGAKGKTPEGEKCTIGKSQKIKELLENFDSTTMSLVVQSTNPDVVCFAEGESRYHAPKNN